MLYRATPMLEKPGEFGIATALESIMLSTHASNVLGRPERVNRAFWLLFETTDHLRAYTFEYTEVFVL
jgi:hypothetical protein